MKKFDIFFTKSKLLKKTIETWIETMGVVMDTDDVLDDKEREYIKKNISKFMHKDIKAMGTAFKLTNKKRKMWAKAGTINNNEEFIEFMYEIGLPIPNVASEENTMLKEKSDEPIESEKGTAEEVETNTQEDNSETEAQIEQETPEEQTKEDAPEENKENTSEKAQETPKNSDVQGG